MRITRFVAFLFPVFLFFSCSHPKLMAPVKKDGKYGYINEDGSFVIDPQFDDAWSFLRGAAIVKKDGKFGLIDKKGNFIVQPEYDSVAPFSSECFLVLKNSLWGFMEHGTGKILIAPQFKNFVEYTEDLCVVEKGNYGLGIVNKDAKMVCPPVLQDLKPFMGPLAIVLQHDTLDEDKLMLMLQQGGAGAKVGMINPKGELVLQPKYDEIFEDEQLRYYYPFVRSENVKQDTVPLPGLHTPVMIGKYGIVDTLGKMISDAKFDELPVYNDGMFRIRIGSKYGFADKNGNVVIQPRFDFAASFSEGKAIVAIGTDAFIIDKTGKTLVDNLGPGAGEYIFSDGMARCRSLDGEWGFMDANGVRVIPPQFQSADDFHHGLAIVGIDDKYGLIDKKGNFAVPPEHDFIFDLRDGFYQVKELNGKAGVIDSLGRTILPAQFDEVYHLQKNYFEVEKDSLNGCYSVSGKKIFAPASSSSIYFFNRRCIVKQNGKWGIIDTTGTAILPIAYDSIGVFFKGYVTVTQNGLSGAADSTGKIIVDPAYDELRPFLNGYAVFRQKDKYGYVNAKGKVVIAAQFEDAAVLVDPDRKEFE